MLEMKYSFSEEYWAHSKRKMIKAKEIHVLKDASPENNNPRKYYISHSA